jgi:hypothetical protein
MIKEPTFTFYEHDHLRADLTTSHRIIAVSSFATKPVRAHADCHPDDNFDAEYGCKLAAARCKQKVAARRIQRAAKKLKEAYRLQDEAIRYVEKMDEYYQQAEDFCVAADEELAAVLAEKSSN